MINIDLENKLGHLESENIGLRELLKKKNELLKSVIDENDKLRARIATLKGEKN